MKKYLAIILALAMTLCLCACTGNNTVPDTSEDNPSASDSGFPNATLDDDTLVVDLDALDKSKDSGNDANADGTGEEDDADVDAESSEEVSAAEDAAPKRTQFSDADKESAKSAAVEMVKTDNQQQDAAVYELKVTDLYNCVVTVGHKVTDNEKTTLFLSDYDLRYDNGQWVKTAAYNRGSFDTSIYDIGYDEAGFLVITPKQG